MLKFADSVNGTFELKKVSPFYFPLKRNSDILSTNGLLVANDAKNPISTTKREMRRTPLKRTCYSHSHYFALIRLRLRTCIMHVLKYSSRIQFGWNKAAIGPIQTCFLKGDPVEEVSETLLFIAGIRGGLTAESLGSFEMQLTMLTIPLVSFCK